MQATIKVGQNPQQTGAQSGVEPTAIAFGHQLGWHLTWVFQLAKDCPICGAPQLVNILVKRKEVN